MTPANAVLAEKIRAAKTLEEIHAAVNALPAHAESEGGIL